MHPPRIPMCPEHFYQLPRWLRDRLRDEFDPTPRAVQSPRWYLILTAAHSALAPLPENR